MAGAGPSRFRVIPTEEGMTLRNFVVRRLRCTRTEAATLIKSGGVFVNQLRIRVPTVRVAKGERVTVHKKALEHQPIDLDSLTIVHRDEHCMVLDKPVGVPVAPTRESAVGTLSEALIRLLQGEGVDRPYVGVLHRLDRQASGLVLFTTRSIANKSLHKQFVDHSIERRYHLLVRGEFPERAESDAHIEARQNHRARVVEPGTFGSKAAHTDFQRLELRTDDEGTLSLLQAQLSTGRTHQIRVHVSHLGFPILGDTLYGGGGSSRMWLHAHTLAFAHPVSGEAIALESALPAELVAQSQ